MKRQKLEVYNVEDCYGGKELFFFLIMTGYKGYCITHNKKGFEKQSYSRDLAELEEQYGFKYITMRTTWVSKLKEIYPDLIFEIKSKILYITQSPKTIEFEKIEEETVVETKKINEEMSDIFASL